MDDDFLVGSFWVTVIAGAAYKYFSTQYNNTWVTDIPRCTAQGDLLRDCGYLVDKASNFQRWESWAFWIMLIAGVCLLFAAIGFIADWQGKQKSS